MTLDKPRCEAVVPTGTCFFSWGHSPDRDVRSWGPGRARLFRLRRQRCEVGGPSGLNLQSEAREGDLQGRGVEKQGCAQTEPGRLGEGSWQLAEPGERSHEHPTTPWEACRAHLRSEATSSGRVHLLSASQF